MNTKTTTIELPRIDGESSRAYAARVEYVTMGAGRSLEKLSQKSTKNIQLFKKWSVQYGWVDSAARYDSEVALLTVNEAADKYRADLETHRKEASEAGHALYTVAGQLIKAINNVLGQPKKIEDKDGKMYTVHNVDLNATTFSIAARAMQTALDLKAHALGVDKLLPSLGNDDSE